MQTNAKKTQKRTDAARYMRRRVAALLFIAVLIVVALFSLSAFFYINNIRVEGDISIYGKSEIIEAAGIKKGGNLFRFSTKRAENRVKSSLLYVANVSIHRKMPDTVVIEITEAQSALVYPYSTGTLVLTQNLTIARDVGLYDGKALAIYGIKPKTYSVGSLLEDEDSQKNENLDKILTALSDNELMSMTSAVCVADKLNLCLVMDKRIFVILGTSGNLERKVLMLGEMMRNQLAFDDMGRLDLSVSGKATFSPCNEEELAELIANSGM